jgi:hypothetical protein
MPMYGLPPGLLRPPRPLSAEEREADDLPRPGSKLGQVPGTMILVLVFFAAFVTYYFLNWKLLSFVWKIG